MVHTSARAVALLWTSDQPVAQTTTFKTQHTQQTGTSATSGIRTGNPIKKADASLCLRLRSHRDRLLTLQRLIFTEVEFKNLFSRKTEHSTCAFSDQSIDYS